MYNLVTCVWEITLACCFSCEYCGSRGGKARKNELSTEECINIAEQLAQLGCRRVSMIGGEVFMRKDWKQIVGKLSSLNINVNVITNGFLFGEKNIKDLKEAGVESVSVSIDGIQEVHDRYRQKGSFRRAINAVETLSAAGIPVSVISTLNSENVKGLEEMYDVLKDKDIYAWQLQACSPMGNAMERKLDYHIDMKEVINFVMAHTLIAPFAIGVADNIGYFTEAEGMIRGRLNGRTYFTGCSAGISAIGIDSVGNVKGCEAMYDDYFIEGNLREKSLKEIWEDPDAFAYNRKFNRSLLTGKCAKCIYGDHCAAGCRSYNYFVHRKLYESPFCAGGAKVLKEAK